MKNIPAGKRPGTLKAEMLLAEVAKQHKVDVKSLKHEAHYPHFVAVRRAFCVFGLKAGINVYALAAALQRDRTTVLYHQRPEMQARKRANRVPWVKRKKRRIYETTGEVGL